MRLNSYTTLFSFVICNICVAQTREGWVKANEDSLIYVSDLYDFDTFEAKAKVPAAEQEGLLYNYYLGEVEGVSTLNGILGLLMEWGATNAELSTNLGRYDTYLKAALQKGATLEQQTVLTSDNSFMKVVNCRHYFLELLKFARTYKKDIYAKDLQNPSLVLAIAMCDRESRRLIELRTKKVNQLVEALNKNQIKARWEEGYLWIGNYATGTYDDTVKDILKSYQTNDIKPEVLAAARKLTAKQKSSVKVLKANAGRFSSDKAKSDFYLSVTQVASPSSYAILSEETNISSYTRYARDTSLASLFGDLNTVVHETCHMCTHRDMQIKRYFVSESIIIPVTPTETYNSHELTKVVPDDKHQFFRATYVFQPSTQSSQTDGIYGLMNEFAAYYNGTKADWEIWTNKEKIFQKHPAYREGLTRLGGDWAAYYEFSVMMAWYLDYSKKQYPEQYKLLLNNKALRVAFTLLSNRFKGLIETTAVQRNAVTSPYLLDLYKESMGTLDSFKLQNCTEANYKGFL